MNILEVIKKAPKDHVYWCTLFGSCKVALRENDDDEFPIMTYGAEECSLTNDGRMYSDLYDGECVLFPSRDNRDWEAFEGGGQAVFDRFCGISGINLDHEYYKNHPYIDFQIDGKEYKVSIEDIKRLVPSDTKDVKERFRIVEKGDDKYNIDIEDKEKDVSGKSFSDNTFDGTAEIVSIPDRPMMAAVIMSGMLARGSKDKGAVLVNKALHFADLILDETETKEETK